MNDTQRELKMTDKTRKPRAKKAVWVLQHETSGDFGLRKECNSTRGGTRLD